MKLLVISIGLFGFLGCSGGGAGGGGSKTMDDLSAKAVKALQAKDPAAYETLFPLKVDFVEIEKKCGRDNPEKRGTKALKIIKRHAARLPKKFAKCAKVIPNWASAKELSREGGTPKKARCEGIVQRFRDLEIIYDVGGTKIAVEIDDPIQINGKFYLTDAPRCRTVK